MNNDRKFVLDINPKNSNPISGKKLYGKKHAERLMKRHVGWNIRELSE
jgi:hypothetical protein